MQNKKRLTPKTIIVAVVLLLMVTTVIFIGGSVSNRKSNTENSKYYNGVVTRVQKLEDTLTKINGGETSNKTEHMFDVYTSIMMVNDRLIFLKENTSGFPDIQGLINDFFIFRDEYGYLVRDQLKGDAIDVEINAKVTKQIQLFLNHLPKKYEDSKAFSDQLSIATEQIKPLLHLNF